MHTHACRIVAFLRVLVRLVPIALGVPPERLERRGQAGGRSWFAIESLKVCRSNFSAIVNTGAR